MDIFQETINRILGKILMERSHLDLVVHAHWAEHEVEDVEQNDAYGNTFFLVCATFAKQFDDTKAIKKSGGCIHGFSEIVSSIFRLYISGFCVILFHRQCLSDVINGVDTFIIHQIKSIVF